MVNSNITNSFNGSMVTLTCSARGGPDNTFSWTYVRTGDVVATEMTDTSFQYNFTADIMSGGEYLCTVSNGAGNETVSAIVNGTLCNNHFLSILLVV